MEIPNFKRCYPNSYQFKDIIKIKSLKNWNVEYVKLTDKIGYWISDSPFYEESFELYKNLISSFPIVDDVNMKGSKVANPFATIHLPEWCCLDIFLLIKSYFIDQIPIHTNMNFFEWGNLYFKDQANPYDYFRLPHCDGANGIVSNLWLTNHNIDESGTALYKYHGNIFKDHQGKMFFDYQVDKKHPRFEECKELALSQRRLDSWKPLSLDEIEYWGFEQVGMAPSIENTMTLYNTELPHSPFVSNKCKFRWSHAYSITYQPLL